MGEERKNIFEGDDAPYRHLLPKKRLSAEDAIKFKEELAHLRQEKRTARYEQTRFKRKIAMQEYWKDPRRKLKAKWRDRIRIKAEQKLVMAHKKEFGFYIKQMKRKIYKKYGRVW